MENKSLEALTLGDFLEVKNKIIVSSSRIKVIKRSLAASRWNYRYFVPINIYEFYYLDIK